jgi:hypothetical protein
VSTTSTVPAVMAAVLDQLKTNMPPGVVVAEEWPGYDGGPEMVFLGEVTWEEYRIPTIKAGRKQRQEQYDIAFQIMVFGGSLTAPGKPTVAKDRAFEIFAALEDVLADDVTAGTDFLTVQHVQVHPSEGGARKHEKGYAYRLAGAITVAARLT